MPKLLWSPNDGAQCAFLAADAREVLYGGAVGGGKSDALRMLALQHAWHPGHRAVILRRERKMLQEIIDRTRDDYPTLIKGAQWHETELRWKLPNGASIYMGHAEHEKDIEKYKSFEFNDVLFDELTEFTEYQYTFMLSRNRSKSADLPLRMRAGTNPGGEGMAWVYRRFIENRKPYHVYKHRVDVERVGDLFITRQYIPSTIFDNPKLPNRDEYIAGLADMDPAAREAMLYGRWGVIRGQFFPAMPKHVAPGYKGEKYGDWYVVRCMDYGWGDPTCILWLVVYPKAGIVEVAHELYGPQMTTDSIAQMVATIETDLRLQPAKVLDSVLSPDAFFAKGEQGVAIATMLGERGVWFRKANNDRISGWAQILRWLERGTLHVWEGRAPNLMRTLPALPRDPNRANDVKSKGVEDHAAEALRYGGMAITALETDGAKAPLGQRRPPNPQDYDSEYDKLVDRLTRGAPGDPTTGIGCGW